MAAEPISSALAGIVGEDRVLTDDDLRAGYERDWTGRFAGTCACVVLPADTAEVSAVLACCAEHGISVVPQGGNTGLVGGGVPRGGEVVLSLTRLDSIGSFEPATGQIEAGAGATLAALQDACRAAGAEAGLDFAARESATVGGIVACDAGGLRALRYGTARARVAGLEAVLADGTVVSRMAGLLKDNAGYDLPALMTGSEGTLGVITRVRWRTVPVMPARVAALVACDSVAGACALLAALRANAPSLESCELMTAAGIELVLGHLGRSSSPLPGDPPFVVLAECAALGDPIGELAEALDAAGAGERAVVADDGGSRAELWRLREAHTEAIAAVGIPHKLDVGVPVEGLERFVTELPAVVERAAPASKTYVFGHIGDGNLHVNVLGPAPEDERADEAVLSLVLDCGGTISAEHGVGVAKAAWLERARGAGEVAAMRAIKRGLDPGGLLNPGAVLAGDRELR